MKSHIITASIALVVGAGLVWQFRKPLIQVKTETLVITKTKENIRIVKESRPDGTVIETKETTVEHDKSTAAKKDETPKSPKWIVSVKRDLLNDSHWTGEVGRAIFDNVYVTSYFRTDNVAGIGLLITF